MSKSIREIWADIESRKEKKFSSQEIPEISRLNCQIGIIGYTGAKIFLMEIESSIEIEKNYLKRFKGVEIQLVRKNHEVNELMIILLEEELTDIFILFIEDLVEKLIPIEKNSDAIMVIHQRINYWRNLFAKIKGVGLSPEKQRGLYGELYFLRLLLSNNRGLKEKINSWRGAFSANQDFAINETAVEVKTTRGRGNTVFISNEMQLDFSNWERLYLCVISVNESAGNNRTLRRIIEDIVSKIASDQKTVENFEEKLELAGIELDEIEAYDEVEYFVRNIKFYEVRGDFPVITKDTIKTEAISETKYRLDISGCKEYQIDQEVILNSIL